MHTTDYLCFVSQNSSLKFLPHLHRYWPQSKKLLRMLFSRADVRDFLENTRSKLCKCNLFTVLQIYFLPTSTRFLRKPMMYELNRVDHFFKLFLEILKTHWRSKEMFSAIAGIIYSSDSRSNITRGKKAKKQISLADQGLTRFHWSRAISKTSFFYFFEFLTHLQFFDFKIILTEKFSQTFRISLSCWACFKLINFKIIS